MKIWTFFQKGHLEGCQNQKVYEKSMPIPAVRTARPSINLQMNYDEFLESVIKKKLRKKCVIVHKRAETEADGAEIGTERVEM